MQWEDSPYNDERMEVEKDTITLLTGLKVSPQRNYRIVQIKYALKIGAEYRTYVVYDGENKNYYGSPGQNKYSTVIGAVLKWFKEEAPNTVKKIEFVFPVVGHSLLPPERVFGRIEKEFGTVKSICSEVPVYDWKFTIHEVVKIIGQWDSKLSLCKRIILTEDTKETIIFREKHFGDTWREREELVYYKILIDGQDDSDEVPEEDENVDQENTDEVLDLVVYVL
ncbi:hypothetical protein ANN_09432 [Periplaneta americana]|uniref:Uncharacterized protein n=1 Tax=Periplaneta americana TaxID=6978 RepID=A0ABQ8TNV1_PERAM|nr:hypothetical protein ANN_09432 [Periplaneta americana]